MLGFLYRMIIGTFTNCEHTRKDVKTVAVYDADNLDKYAIYTKYVVKCEYCGKYKSFKV